MYLPDYIIVIKVPVHQFLIALFTKIVNLPQHYYYFCFINIKTEIYIIQAKNFKNRYL